MASGGADRRPATASGRIRDCIGTLLLRAHPRTRKQGWKPARRVRALAGAAQLHACTCRPAKHSHPFAVWRVVAAESALARAGIAAAMPSASQSDRVDGPLLRGRSPDLRVGVDASGRGAFPWTPLRAWTVADALARTRLPLRGQCRPGRSRRVSGARVHSPSSRFTPLATAPGSPRTGG